MLKSAFGMAWVGGKCRLSAKIVPLFPEHEVYVDVFGGGAHVLCRKPPSLGEVYNDTNGDLVNLFRCLREPHLRTQMVEYLALTPYSRSQFEAWRDEIGSDTWFSLPAWERGARWFAVLRMAFGAKAHRASWGYSLRRRSWAPRHFRSATLALRALAKRLSHVQIENLDFEECIRRYDSPETLFYCDPPYVGVEHYYGGSRFTAADHERLARVLEGIEGAAAVSYAACPTIDKLYGPPRWRRRVFSTRRSLGPKGRGTAVTELLIMNYEPAASRGPGVLCHTTGPRCRGKVD